MKSWKVLGQCLICKGNVYDWQDSVEHNEYIAHVSCASPDEDEEPEWMWE